MEATQDSRAAVLDRPAGGAVDPASRTPVAADLAAVAKFVPCELTSSLANDAAWMASCVASELDRVVVCELRAEEVAERLEVLCAAVRRCGAMCDAIAGAHGGHPVRGDVAAWLAGSPGTGTGTGRAARLLTELAQKREGGVA